MLLYIGTPTPTLTRSLTLASLCAAPGRSPDGEEVMVGTAIAPKPTPTPNPNPNPNPNPKPKPQTPNPNPGPK
jgi:hypothetical protein